PTLRITAGSLGWPFAVANAFAAVGLGLFGGFAVKLMIRQGAFAAPLKVYHRSGCCGSGPKLDGSPEWRFWQEEGRRAVFRGEFLANGLFLLKWPALAYVLEALLVSYVPADLIARVVGGEGVGSIAIAALVGMPAYLNAYVAPPLLAGLVEQGMSLGAAMAFMIAGGVSSIPAMAAVWSLVKPRVFTAYLVLGVVGAILSGMVFQMI
ncbi:MAG: permease, partial [Arenibacterium sp.]